MYTKTARHYDLVYSWKDYAGEAERLHALITDRKRCPQSDLLDVACGTGAHIPYLRERYAVEGLDLSTQMLEVARQRNPGLTFHLADMTTFDLGRQFAVVTCLFSSIGYSLTVPRLQASIATMARHLRPGGVLVVEPWLSPDSIDPDRAGLRCAEEPEIKIARMDVIEVEGRTSTLNFHYLVRAGGAVEYLTERHLLGLFTDDEYREAFRKSGLEVSHDPDGLMGRGLYVGSAI